MVEFEYSSCPKCGYKFGDESEIENYIKKKKSDLWRCKKCGATNRKNTISCIECGNYK